VQITDRAKDILFVGSIPKTSVGKFAKRELRGRLKDYRWPDRSEE
jgi:acyl-CoA synthetase (AMP-forming)/AMP-acid ligase II